MFAALQNYAPKMETRRALLLLNMQNDAFGIAIDLKMAGLDVVDNVKTVVPAFRRLGDIVWVQTEVEMGRAPSGSPIAPASPSAPTQPASRSHATHMGLDHYFPTSRARAVHKQSAPGSEPQANLDEFDGDDPHDSIAAFLQRTAPGRAPFLYAAGSYGAQITDGLLPYVDAQNDLQIVKHHHSAFDATTLLMSLRMKFVTHLYLAGTMSNISVYATAADAVRHGFEVSVVEDCLGYRSELRHIEAMGKMADFLGVSGVDTEEILAEAHGGEPPPDADESLISGPGLEGIKPTRSASSSASSHRPGDDFQPPPLHVNGQAHENGDEHRSWAGQSTPAGGSPGDRLRSPRGSNEPTERSTPSGGDGSPEVAMLDAPLRPERRRTPHPLGPGDTIADGDTQIIYQVLSAELIAHAFESVREEAQWQVMHHQTGEVPRRVAVQGEMGSHGAVPIYRHPADEAPPLLEFSPTVRRIRDELQKRLQQPFNHVLIQLYRSGDDHITEHSDKTLDVVRGSDIVNLSLGAERAMTLRTKRSAAIKREDGSLPAREMQRVPMPHNSVFVLGWRSNQRWLHGVRADKRPAREKSDAERAYGGARISLTFRHIGTFVSHDRRRIWGQGARSKWEATAGEVSTTNSAEMEAMINAFGRENQQIDFDWDATYGRGFDVLNLVASRSTLYLCSDELANTRVKLCALHCNMDCKLTRTRPDSSGDRSGCGNGDDDALRHTTSGGASATNGPRRTYAPSHDESPVLREAEPNGAEVEGDLAILFHLNKFFPTSAGGGAITAANAMAGVLNSSYAHSNGGSPRPTSLAGFSTAGLGRSGSGPPANLFARITQANELLFLWQELRGRPLTASTRATHQIRRLSTHAPSATISAATATRQLPPPHAPPSHRAKRPPGDASPLEAFEGELAVWAEYAAEAAGGFIAGHAFGIVDCAFWPVLDEITRRWEGWSERRYPHLAHYWRRVGALQATREALSERLNPPRPGVAVAHGSREPGRAEDVDMRG